MKENLRGIFIKAVIVALAGILVYVTIGTVANALNVVTYDSFPGSFECYPPSSEKELSCSIHNNAFLTLPYINPFYVARLAVSSSNNGSFAYFLDSGDNKRNASDWGLDLGSVSSGKSIEFRFFLHVNQSDTVLRIDIFYPLPLYQPVVSSVSYLVKYNGNYSYTVSKT